MPDDSPTPKENHDTDGGTHASSLVPHLYLIGPRGCGKSTIGQRLARRMAWNWCDLDEEIEQASGETVAEIFARSGQNGFRELESQHLNRVAQGQPQVVSLGGGAVLRPENRQLIGRSGRVVLLVATPEILVERILADPQSQSLRPSLLPLGEKLSEPPAGDALGASNTAQQREELRQLEEMQQVLSLRMPIYQQCADLKLDTSHCSIDSAVEQILRWLPRADERFAGAILLDHHSPDSDAAAMADRPNTNRRANSNSRPNATGNSRNESPSSKKSQGEF